MVDLAAAGAPVAFYAVFGVFVAAFGVLAAVTVRWAVRRDRAGRAGLGPPAGSSRARRVARRRGGERPCTLGRAAAGARHQRPLP